jgi:hypothetical protein
MNRSFSSRTAPTGAYSVPITPAGGLDDLHSLIQFGGKQRIRALCLSICSGKGISHKSAKWRLSYAT